MPGQGTKTTEKNIIKKEKVTLKTLSSHMVKENEQHMKNYEKVEKKIQRAVSKLFKGISVLPKDVMVGDYFLHVRDVFIISNDGLKTYIKLDKNTVDKLFEIYYKYIA